MSGGTELKPQFVVRAEDLGALHHLPQNCPRPLDRVWINRATNRRLASSSVELLLRTLYNDIGSKSVVELHRNAGLQLSFEKESERLQFASQFDHAKAELRELGRTHASAIFDTMQSARDAAATLLKDGMEEEAVSLFWRANLFLDPSIEWHKGHGTLSVASAAMGGGAAGLALALAAVLVPGLGQVAAAGAAAATGLSAITSFGGVVGATGGVIAKMLTDNDVDGNAADFYEQQIERGKILVSVSLKSTDVSEGYIRRVFRENGGQVFNRA